MSMSMSMYRGGRAALFRDVLPSTQAYTYCCTSWLWCFLTFAALKPSIYPLNNLADELWALLS